MKGVGRPKRKHWSVNCRINGSMSGQSYTQVLSNLVLKLTVVKRRYVFLTGGALNCDWWWRDLARLAPKCKTRDAIIHHFFPSIHYIAETHDARYFKFPYTFWLSTRTVPRFDAAYMKGLVAAVGKMHRAQGGKIKGIAEDRMPAFHSNFEPNVPSERTEHMLAQVNKITTFISKKSSKATPVPWEMNMPSLIRTDAIISLE